MSNLATLLLALDAVTLAIGGVVTSFTYRAFRRTDSPGLRLVSIAVGIVTLGTVLPGAAHLLAGSDPTLGLVAGTALVTLGFVVVTYALYAEYPSEAA
ncbi:DUF7521 family protein [Halorussus amylolyticus]|uniref:DUF7521 family protein n=1 Tax=Halorussus amylolyticus TaxID=1126242 RepID=UPI00104F3867|nr:hypothetical protein [Halorussus amylolyticus]